MVTICKFYRDFLQSQYEMNSTIDERNVARQKNEQKDQKDKNSENVSTESVLDLIKGVSAPRRIKCVATVRKELETCIEAE